MLDLDFVRRLAVPLAAVLASQASPCTAVINNAGDSGTCVKFTAAGADLFA